MLSEAGSIDSAPPPTGGCSVDSRLYEMGFTGKASWLDSATRAGIMLNTYSIRPSDTWSCPAMTDTIPFGSTREVSHGGQRRRAVSARVQGPDRRTREAGRSPGSLAREFEPSEQTIRNWVKQADLDEGRRSDGLTTEARRKPAAPEAGEQAAARGAGHPKASRGLVCEGERIDPQRGYTFMKAPPGRVHAYSHVPGAGSLHQRLSRLAASPSLATDMSRRRAQGPDQGDLARERRDVRQSPDPRDAGGPKATGWVASGSHA